MSERNQELAEALSGPRNEALVAWWKEHGASLKEALGVYAPDEVMLAALCSYRENIGGRFNMFKDDLDRARCDVLHDFVQGRKVHLRDARVAVALLMQTFGAACDAIWMHRKREHERPPRVPIPRG